MAELRNRTRAPVSSRTSIALSGKKRSAIYCEASFTHATRASSENRNLWCASYFRAKPLRISMVSSTVGSGTMTGWKRRSSALSFSTYFLYSSMVVAPITCKSPRESAGFMMFAASMAPPPPPSPPPPAPTIVWISSIIRMMFPSEATHSLMMLFNRSSNSPRNFVPDSKEPRSKRMMRLPSSMSGTSPVAILKAKPSAIAVLPTPGSPISTGLFFCRRARIWIARSISSSRPTSGSTSPFAAICVRSFPNSSRVLPGFFAWPCCAVEASSPFCLARASLNSFVIIAVASLTSTFNSSRSAMTPGSRLLKMARRMCDGSIGDAFIFLASSIPALSAAFASAVNGSSVPFCVPLCPMTLSTALRMARRSTLKPFSVLAPKLEPSATMPTTIISVPTCGWPNLFASSCASITALMAFSSNFSNIMFIEESAEPLFCARGACTAGVTDPAMLEPRKPLLRDERLAPPLTGAAKPPDVATLLALSAARAILRRGRAEAKLCASLTARPATAATAAAPTPAARPEASSVLPDSSSSAACAECTFCSSAACAFLLTLREVLAPSWEPTAPLAKVGPVARCQSPAAEVQASTVTCQERMLAS
mmetsp:Transcript_63263/g.117693  ORF Transcript_63263/g.117693 Transcript_63263/m.117693 type:complete len:595 (-) Transcript_63263:44-1828(-)